MDIYLEQKNSLLKEIEKLQEKYQLSQTVQPDYFEPGMMEFLDQYYGSYEEKTGTILIRFDARGTRYEGRTEQIERVNPGDPIQIIRDTGNKFNPNNFTMLIKTGANVGHMPAELCNAIAPLYDAGQLQFEAASVSYVEPISKRSRYAKQAVLFVELKAHLCAK